MTLTLLAAFLLCPPGAAANPVQYSYDAGGRLAAVFHGGEKTITCGYDVNGNLVAYTARGGTKRGDLNLDDDVNLIDALAALRLLSGLPVKDMDITGYLESQRGVLLLLGLSEVIHILRDIADLR